MVKNIGDGKWKTNNSLFSKRQKMEESLCMKFFYAKIYNKNLVCLKVVMDNLEFNSLFLKLIPHAISNIK